MQRYSRSRNALPSFTMSEQSLEEVITTVQRVNALSPIERRVASGQPMHASASLSARMTMHAGIFRKLKRKINDILAEARAAGLHVEVDKPPEEKGRGDYTISLSNASICWQHRVSGGAKAWA